MDHPGDDIEGCDTTRDEVSRLERTRKDCQVQEAVGPEALVWHVQGRVTWGWRKSDKTQQTSTSECHDGQVNRE